MLRGKILVHNHCYRADEMMQMIDLGEGIRIPHPVVPSRGRGLQDRRTCWRRIGVAASVWADWWGFKMESFDGVRENAALIQKAGARAIIHSDSEDGIQRLNQEAAKAMYAGIRAGLGTTREEAIRWLTANPAWALGIDSTTGTLEAGKHADVVIWSGDPFSVYSKAERVYNDGWLVYDRNDPAHQPKTDFNLGTAAPGWVDEKPPACAEPRRARRPGTQRPDHRHSGRHGVSGLRASDRERNGADQGWADSSGRHRCHGPRGRHRHRRQG